MSVIEEPIIPVSPFGVKLRSTNTVRKDRAPKAYSMSFLERSSQPNQQFLVREFNDPFPASVDREADSLCKSQNKWSATAAMQLKDSNRNENARLSNKNSNRSSCSFSDEVFYTGNELKTISDDAKPILKLWASKNKQSVTKRISEIGTSSTSPVTRRGRERNERPGSYLEQGLNNTPWEKYFRPRSSLLSQNTSAVMPLKCEMKTGNNYSAKTNDEPQNNFTPMSQLSFTKTTASKENIVGKVEAQVATSTCSNHKEQVSRPSPKFEPMVGKPLLDSKSDFKNVRAKPPEGATKKIKADNLKTDKYNDDDVNNNKIDIHDTKTRESENNEVNEKHKSKENSTVKRLIRIKSLDIKELRFSRRGSNKDEGVIKGPATLSQTKSLNGSQGQKDSLKHDREEKKKSSNKKKQHKKAKSASFKSEYVRIDFLQKPQKIEKIVDETLSNVKGEDNFIVSAITLSDKDNLCNYTNTGINNKSQTIDSVSVRRSTSLIANSSCQEHYNTKEDVEKRRLHSLSSRVIDVDFERPDTSRSHQEYTDIDDQVSGVLSPNFTQQAKKFYQLDNIPFVHRESEPAVKTAKQKLHVKEENEGRFLKDEIVHVFNSKFENNLTKDIIDDFNNTEMSSSCKSKYSSTPGSYLNSQRTSLDSLIIKSTNHSKYGFELNISNNDRLDKCINEHEVLKRNRIHLDNNIIDCYSENSENYCKKTRHFSEPKSYNELPEKASLNSNNLDFYPKSSYLRQRLHELGEFKNTPKSVVQISSSSIHGNDYKHCLVRSLSATNEKKYDPTEVDSFIKNSKECQLNYLCKRSLSATAYSSESNLGNILLSTDDKLSGKPLLLPNDVDKPSSIVRRRVLSSQSVTNYNIVENSSKNFEHSFSRDSKSPVSDKEEMDKIFHRNLLNRSSGNRFVPTESKEALEHNTELFQLNNPICMSDRSIDKQSPFTRNISARSSNHSTRSISPLVSPISATSSNSIFSSTTPSPVSPKITSKFHTPSLFSSIKKVHSSRISGVEELKTSAKKNNSHKGKDNEINTTSKHRRDSKDDASSHNVTETTKQNGDEEEHHSKNNFSFFHKKKHSDTGASPSSPKQQQRKHSLSNIFSLKKHTRDKDVTPPTSPKVVADKKSTKRRNSVPTSPTSPTSPILSPRVKDRRGSAFMKLFQKKTHHSSNDDVTRECIEDIMEAPKEDEEHSKTDFEKRTSKADAEQSIVNNLISPDTCDVNEIENVQFDKDSVQTNVQSSLKVSAGRTRDEYIPKTNVFGDAKDGPAGVGQTVKTKGLSITVNGIKTIVSEDKEFLVESGKEEGFVFVEEAPFTLDTVNKTEDYGSNHNYSSQTPHGENIQTREKKDSNLLSVDAANGDLGSSESLYDSDCGAKRGSRNRERIRSRKAARREAQERHKSLPAGLGDFDITQCVTDTRESNNYHEGKDGTEIPVDCTAPSLIKVKKKHKARRANTEFITNVPNFNTNSGDSPPLSRDDGVVMRRNNKRNMRRDRSRTLTVGIDSELIFDGEKNEEALTGSSGVVQENMSFADIKKKLLEGLTDDKKIPEKLEQKERQKIKRTKSTKRYKTITEGIAPRDLELAKQALDLENAGGNGRTVIDKDTLEQITAALTSTTDNRKSFLVESRPGSRYQSLENLNLSDPDLAIKDVKNKDVPRPAPLQRTKSMTTMHLQLDKNEDDAEEPEIKPLSELKNRFLQAMEDTKQKHLTKKTPIEIKQRNRGRSRQDRPHTICGLDNYTMEQLQNEIEGKTPENELKTREEEKQRTRQHEIKLEIEKQKEIDNEKNRLNEIKARPVSSLSNGIITSERGKQEETSKKREKKQYSRNDSKKLFDDLFDDIDDILDEGLSELDLASLIGCNPSLHQEVPVDLEITGNKKEKEALTTDKQNDAQELSNGPQDLSDLDFISSQSTQLSSTLLSDKRNVKPKRRQRTNANPVKSLQQREDLVDETEINNKTKEERTSQHPVVEAYKGLRQTADDKNQNPVERLLNRDLADEAVSALRATVDFSKTKLRKVEVGQKSSDVLAESFVPSEVGNLLIQVKGRKKVQATVVEYNADSLNSNDCFVVVTPKELVCWNGAQSNVIERAKAAEIASRINQKKEMGCKAFDVLYLDQGGNDAKVLRMLDSTALTINTSRKATYDEDFEKTMTSAYMTYVVCATGESCELVPLESQCHKMPSKDILQTDAAFVFDFVAEVYVWLGRQTNSQQRKTIQELAAKKFEEGSFQLKLENSPVHLPHLGNSRKISITADASHYRSKGQKGQRRVSTQLGRQQKRELVPRPPHSLLLQFFEGSEWVIFKEKFCDWPDESRIIRMKGGPGSVGEVIKEVSTEVSIAPVDPKTMVEVPPMYKMVLENLDVGRGRGIPKGMDGYHIITLDVKTWHVSENNSILLPDASFAQFHSGEGYVIRWQYRVVKVRALRNCDDVMKAGGMERCCYFFWLGNDCSVNEEGATAVMTIELDQEKGPQVRVLLGKEPPALLNLFDGCMVIHAGKRPAPGIRTHFTDQSVIRLYCVRNEEPSEGCLLQVPAMCESLRSRSSFVLLLCNNGEVFLWHGCKSNEGTRKTAEHIVQMLIQNHPDEAGIGDKTEIGFHEIEEGDEPEVFWIALGGQEDYGSLLDDESDLTCLSPRLFHLDPTTDVFMANEVRSPSCTPVFNCPFPVLQDDMYNIEQPAIFLLDAITHVWLWFGWWPDEAETEASMSRRRRWGEERRKAMESAVAYAKEVGRNIQTMYSVFAGLEPESFIELFPYWVVQNDITDLQLDEGVEEDRLYKITEELAMFRKEFYTIEELLEKPAPQGVDPTKLEKYLSEEDFLEVFKFHKATFYKLPTWQQTNWKKKVGLY